MEPRNTIVNLIKSFITLYDIKPEEVGFNSNGSYVPVEHASEYKIKVTYSKFNGVYQSVAENLEIIKPTKYQNTAKLVFADSKDFNRGRCRDCSDDSDD